MDGTISLEATGVQPRAPSAVPASDAGGRSLPVAGKSRPPETAPKLPSIEGAVEQIRTWLSQSQRELEFQFDKSAGRTVIRVIDPGSGDVIRQIPAEEVLKMAAAIEASAKHIGLIDQTA